MNQTFEPRNPPQSRPARRSSKRVRVAQPHGRPRPVDNLLAAAGEYPVVIRDAADVYGVDLSDAERTAPRVSDTAETHPRVPLTMADAEAVLARADGGLPRTARPADRTDEIAIEDVLEEIYIEPSAPPTSSAPPPPSRVRIQAVAPAAPVAPVAQAAPPAPASSAPAMFSFDSLRESERLAPVAPAFVPAPPETAPLELAPSTRKAPPPVFDPPPSTLRAAELAAPPSSAYPSTPTPPPMVLPLVTARPAVRHPGLVEVAPPVPAVALPPPVGLPILPRTTAKPSRAPIVIATAFVLALLGTAVAFAAYVFLPTLMPDPAPVTLSEGGWSKPTLAKAEAPKAEAPKADAPKPAKVDPAPAKVDAPAKAEAAKPEPAKAAPAKGEVPTLSVESLPSAPATKGTVVFGPSASGHRAWIDGAIVNPDARQTIACGLHAIRVGSAGKARTVNVPCGGEVVVEP